MTFTSSAYPSITPSLEQFRELAATRRVIPVRLTVLAEELTPVGLYRTLVARDGQGVPGSFLLESAHEGRSWSRYSFIGVSSRSTLTEKDGQVCWQGIVPQGAPTSGTPVEAVEQTLALLHTEEPLEGEELPPLTSGLVGYVGWDAVRHWERLPHPPEDDLQLPELALNVVSDLAIHDHHEGTVTLVANAINWDGSNDRVDEAYAEAVSRVEAMLEKLADPVPAVPAALPDSKDLARQLQEQVHLSWDDARFHEQIAVAQQAITEGDIFQVVLSRRFRTPNQATDLAVYRMLRRMNPSPYMYLHTFESPQRSGEPFSIVGSSPEALVTVQEGRASTHPIAGSRPRGADPAEDHALAAELLADEKERSEHLMLVDLARNDLSKIARPGSVVVTEFMVVERFSHIMHLSSTVEAELAERASAFDVLRATFPAGTLSGAPKPMAMRLLDEYEPVRRGIYGGVVGYVDFAGNMDMAIAIRTALLTPGQALVQAGAGIVADSVPAAEAAETVSKSAAPLRAVLLAQNLQGLSARAAEEGQR